MKPNISPSIRRQTLLGIGSSLALAALIPGAVGAKDNRLSPDFQAPVLTQEQTIAKTFVQPDDCFYAAAGNLNFPVGFDRLNDAQTGDLVRFNANGTRDTGFTLDPTLQGYYIDTVAPTPDGHLIIAAARPFSLVPYQSFFYGAARFQVFLLNADGSRVTTFNAGSGTAPLRGDNEDNGIAAFVRDVVVQPDGKILVGGQFSDFSGSGYPGLVRLNADGSVDTTFARQAFHTDTPFANQPTGIAASSQTLLLQPDGKILVLGAFNELDGVSFPGVARLHADGSVDPSFVPSGFALAQDPDSGEQLAPRAAVIQADGKILIGAPFAAVGDPAPVYPLVLLNPDGSLDQTFATPIDPSSGQPITGDGISSVRRLPDGRIAAAIYDTLYLFNADGTANATVDSDTNTAYSADPYGSGFGAVSVQSGGQLLLPGEFDSVGGSPRPGGLARYVPAADGSYSLDPAFVLSGPAALNISVDRVGLRSDGKILLRGAFDTAAGQPRMSVALLDADGTLDAQAPTSASLFIDPPENLLPGALVLPGDQTLLYGPTPPSDQNGPGFTYLRLHADGTPDETFQMDPGVAAFERPLVQPDGKILLSRGAIFGDEFNNDGPQAILDGTLLTRLNADGTPDATFTLGLDLSSLIGRDSSGTIATVPTGDSRALAVLPDGRIMYKYFDGINFILVRLLPNGVADPTFQQGTASGVPVLTYDGFALPSLSDPGTGNGGVPTLGSQFATGAGINAVLALPDGRLLVAGDFTSFNGVAAGGLVRLQLDGQVDATFRSGAGAEYKAPGVIYGQDASVGDVQLEADGRLLVVGSFDTFDGGARPGIARLNFNGSLDTTFVPPVVARVTGGSASLNQTSSLYPLAEGGFLLTGNYAAPSDAAGAGPRALFRLKPDASKVPVLTVAAPVAATTVGGAPGEFILARAGDLSSPLTVNFRVGGKAEDGVDYKMLVDPRQMPAGKSTVTLKVRALANAGRTDARGVKVTLLPGNGYQLGDQLTAKVMIVNGD